MQIKNDIKIDLLGQKNHTTSRDKIMQNPATSRGKKRHATSQDKKNHTTSWTKKSCNLLGQKITLDIILTEDGIKVMDPKQ